MFESFIKGGILLFSKEAVIKVCTSLGANEVTSGIVGGFGGGIAQVFTAYFSIIMNNRDDMLGIGARSMYFSGDSSSHRR